MTWVPVGFSLRRVGDLAEVFDGPHATPRKVDSGPWYLSIASLKNGRLDLSESTHIHQDDVAKWTRRVMPKQGDTLFSYETRLGESAYWDRDEQAVLGRRMGLLRPRVGLVDSRFLAYAYMSEQFQATIRQGILYGATVDRIPVGELPMWPILVPDDIGEQRRIADVLGAFDDLIETNRSLAEDLDALSFGIEWEQAEGAPRVRFDSVARRVVERVNPGAFAADTPYLGLEHFATGGRGLASLGTTSGVSSTSLQFDSGDVLYGKLRPYFRKVSRPGFAGVCSAEIWVLRALNGHSQGALHAIVHSPEFSATAMAGHSGTRMPRADWDHIAEHEVPDLRNVLDSAHQAIVDECWRAGCELREEANDLARQRDELLPLLTSGRVRVSEL